MLNIDTAVCSRTTVNNTRLNLTDYGTNSLIFMGKMGRNAPELNSRSPQNRHHAFQGPKFTKFLPELWSLAAGTLIRCLEY